NATFMKSEGKEQGSKVEHLEYKPELQASLIAGYKFDFGLTPQIELEHIGKQYALNAISGKFDELENYTLLNFRIGYNFDLYGNNIEVFARINNITDEYFLTQIGLPGYGRTFTCGISVRY
ncbi:MAG TPA: TonB-dependent receptor, partial [Candidatus Kapabacteria bacterium]|nr:TonB-dependent receptor [Candidatus Kapabacteria bacterium]